MTTILQNSNFHSSSDDKESTCDARDPGVIPRSGRSPEEGNGYPLQYSCLENSMDRGAWRATVRAVTESDTTEQVTHNTPGEIHAILFLKEY